MNTLVAPAVTATRYVALDTETTGLEVTRGDRVIEIGATEIRDHKVGASEYHVLLNPERAISLDASEVHGLTDASVASSPKFRDIGRDLVTYLRGATLIGFNTAFDIAFLNNEMHLMGSQYRIEEYVTEVIDVLALARKQWPGRTNDLDTVCRRLGIPLTGRARHGALIDAQLTAAAYLELSQEQEALTLNASPAPLALPITLDRPALVVQHASAAEREAHAQYLRELQARTGVQPLWLRNGPH